MRGLIPIDDVKLAEAVRHVQAEFRWLKRRWTELAAGTTLTSDPEIQKALLWLHVESMSQLDGPSGLDKLYEEIATTGRRFSQRGFPFAAIVNSFHFYEQACFESLKRAAGDNPDKFGETLNVIDAVIHNVFGVIATSYFEEISRRLEEKSKELERTNADLTRMADEMRWKNLQLQELLSTDSLTGVYNHRYFYERLEEEFYRAKRYQHHLSCLLLDIDGFKNYNDLYGHRVGDYVLEETAILLRGDVRTSDVVARYGGDEFGIILPSTEKAHARLLAERLRHTLANHNFQHEQIPDQTRISFSTGVVNYPEDVTEFRQLVPMADRALLQAKRLGKNKVCGLRKAVFSFAPKPELGQVRSVCLVGDFNGWNPGANSMEQQDGRWSAELLLPEGPVKYKFVLNGAQWITDPDAAHSSRDGLGSWNSIIYVGDVTPSAHPTENVTTPTPAAPQPDAEKESGS
ncbi:MAG TPA: diguanylate cyclase [Candidatus Brocadiia bacterium]|nr:diguanylate cyclase [Candidatus Brocadiia bacterium]